jgi:excisionase family DNA binding protein
MDSVKEAATAPTQYKTRRGWESGQAQPLLVSKHEAAQLLGVCVRSIDNYIGTKQLPCRRLGRRVLIPFAALQQFAKRDHMTKAPESQ